jgi:hypothetical protein
MGVTGAFKSSLIATGLTATTANSSLEASDKDGTDVETRQFACRIGSAQDRGRMGRDRQLNGANRVVDESVEKLFREC